MWSNLALIAGYFFSSFHVSFSYAFRNQNPWNKWYVFLLPSFIVSLFLIFGIGGYTDPVIYYSEPASVLPGLFALLYIPFNLISIFCTAWILLAGYKKLPRAEQNQILMVFIGLAIMKIGGLLFAVVLPLLGVYAYYSLAPIFSYAALIGIGLSISRYQFLDIRLVIQRGAIYAILFALLVAGYIVSTILFTFLFSGDNVAGAHIGFGTTLLLGFLLLPRVDTWLRKVTNPWFFKETYDYLEASRSLQRIVQRHVSVQDITQSSISEFQRFIATEEMAIISIDQSQVFTEKDTYPISPEITDRLTTCSRQKIQDCEFLPTAPAKWCAENNYVSFCPILFDVKTVGVIFLGMKKNGELFNTMDRRVIEHLASQLSAALEKAHLYDKQAKQSEILEQEIKKRTKQIKTLQQSQEKAMLDISHALKTPLTILRSEIEALPKNNRSVLEQTIGQVSHSVTSILTLARLSSESADTNTKELIDLSALCELLVQHFSEIPSAADLAITSHIRQDCFINANYRQIEDMLVNLIENAIQYMPSQEEKEVQVHLDKDPQHITLKIKDNGLGIPLPEQDKLFTRFYRSPQTKDIPGTGLGLAICKEVVELSDGTISVESSPGSTIFTITLPTPENN